MATSMTSQRIRRENRLFRGTGGISQNNRAGGFVPAFCDTETGRTEISRFASGIPASIHLLCGLPNEWVVSRDAGGGVAAVKASVISGFLRDGRFYSREEAARTCAY
jgi:hypothetical protein